MATWSATELANEVLKVLGIVGSGQTAVAEDLSRVSVTYTSTYRHLRRLGLAPWPSGAIDDDAKEAVAKYVAGDASLLKKFGFTGQAYGEMRDVRGEGLRDLQENYSSNKEEAPVQNDYW